MLKNIFRRSRLRKLAYAGPTGLVPMNTIHSATIVWDRYDNDLPTSGRFVEKFLRNNGIKVTMLILDQATRKELETMQASGQEVLPLPDFEEFTIITRKGVNWFGQPKTKLFHDRLSAATDLFINLSTSTDFPSVFISAISHARMKIGVVRYPGHPFDIVLSDGSLTGTGDGDGADDAGNAPAPAIETEKRTADKVYTILKFIQQII